MSDYTQAPGYKEMSALIDLAAGPETKPMTLKDAAPFLLLGGISLLMLGITSIPGVEQFLQKKLGQ